MAVKKKKSSKKKGRSATRFGLEILALWALLVVAAYVGNWGKSSSNLSNFLLCI